MKTIPLLVLFVACQDSSPKDTALDDTGAIPTPSIEIGAWEACDLVPGSGDRQAECAEVLLPWNYDDPASERLSAMVKRAPASVKPAVGQVWLLHGGPGASAIDELSFLPSGLRESRPDIDVYAVDHRGIGASARLACPAQESTSSDGGAVVTEAEWPDCYLSLSEQWGEHLDQINVSNSARDIGALIQALAVPSQPTFVYAGSYGTYLAQRYLQFFPEQAAGVVLDGISVPDVGFEGYDSGMNAAGRDLFQHCAEDPSCASHFDRDPWQVATDTIEAFDKGHCAALGTNGDFIRYFTGALLMYDKVRDIVPAMVHRLDRCNDDDVEVIVNLYYAYTGALGSVLPGHRGRMPVPGMGRTAGNDGDGYSLLLFYHVALSEMWYLEGTISYTEAVDAWRETTMATGLETWLAARQGDWPRFPTDEWHDLFPETQVPMLLLQGGLDPATTVAPALKAAAHYQAPHQTLAYFPQGAHGMLSGSTLPDGGDCGNLIFQAFLNDPTAELDLSCIDQTLPVQWDGFKEYNGYFLGTQDVWGD